jgi:hypothetical protein
MIANHQSAIRQKFGANNSVQLVQIAQRLGLQFSGLASPHERFGSPGPMEALGSGSPG